MLAALVGAAVLPVAVAVAESTKLIRLIEAAAAIAVAGVLGVLALVLATRARRLAERTIGRVGGTRIARAGKALGVVAVSLALSGAIAVGFYHALTRLAD